MIDDYEYLRALDPKEFFRRVASAYGIDPQQLEALDKDFELIPRGQFSPDDGVVTHKSVAEVAADVGLPLNYVLHLQQIGVISKFLTYADIDFLRRHRLAIEDENGCVKPKRKKRSLAPRVELKEPWKTYVYIRYLTNKIIYNSDGTMLNPEKRIFLKSLIKEVFFRFSVPKTSSLMQEIEAIRTIATNDKRKAHKQNVTLEEVAKERGVAGNMDIFQPVTGFAKEIQLTF